MDSPDSTSPSSAQYEVSTVQPALIEGSTMQLGITHPVNDKGAIKYPVMSISVDGLAFAFDRAAVDHIFRFIYAERRLLFEDGKISPDGKIGSGR